ncbi:MAG: hypothetical protein AAGG45_08525, partial [Pseudomonadota bacterium]
MIKRRLTGSGVASADKVADPGVPRSEGGCIAGKAASWARMSGDAFSTTHDLPSIDTATEDCVMGAIR